MSYTSQSGIEAVYGTHNVAQWSNLDNDATTADAARIATAISYAEAYMNDALRDGRYEIPFGGTAPTMIADMAAKMAGVWLYNTRRIRRAEAEGVGEAIQGHQDEVDSLLAAINAGQRVLDAPLSHSYATAPQVV